MNGNKAHKKTKNISINNVNEVQHQQVTEVSKEDGDFLTLLYSPQPLRIQFPGQRQGTV